MNILAENKKAHFAYEILEAFQAGIALLGHEVKSIRQGQITLLGAFVVLRGGEAFLVGSTIAPYQPKNTPNDYDPTRARKLLLTKDEIDQLVGKTHQKGLTLVPLKVYSKNNRIKLEFGIARGLKKANKKELIRKKETKKEIERELKRI